VHNRTRSKAQHLIDAGAQWCDTVQQAVEDAAIVITMLGYPRDVEQLYLGGDGIVEHAKEGACLIDMTTSRPGLAREIHDRALVRGISCLDAPVSGGDVGARNATLTIMVGGEQVVFDQMLPMLRLLGENVILQGAPGCGQHTKMCNQIVIATAMIGTCEALAYAQKSGLDPHRVLQSIRGGAAGSWTLTNLAPRIVNGDFEPGFYIHHFIKDLTIAREEALLTGTEFPGLELALRLYKSLNERVQQTKGTQALAQLYR
jgi:3-hydroxyisobutyrate dehydrogenase